MKKKISVSKAKSIKNKAKASKLPPWLRKKGK